jgi:hypothetical protein
MIDISIVNGGYKPTYKRKGTTLYSFFTILDIWLIGLQHFARVSRDGNWEVTKSRKGRGCGELKRTCDHLTRLHSYGEHGG